MVHNPVYGGLGVQGVDDCSRAAASVSLAAHVASDDGWMVQNPAYDRSGAQAADGAAKSVTGECDDGMVRNPVYNFGTGAARMVNQADGHYYAQVENTAEHDPTLDDGDYAELLEACWPPLALMSPQAQNEEDYVVIDGDYAVPLETAHDGADDYAYSTVYAALKDQRSTLERTTHSGPHVHAHGSGLNHYEVIDDSNRKGMRVGQVSTGETEG